MGDEKPKRAVMFYYQFASVILLLVLVGFTISGIWGLLKMFIPRVTVSGFTWQKVSSFEGFVEDKYREEDGLYYRKYEKADTTKATALKRQDVEAKWRSAQSEALDDERRAGLQEILYWLVVVVICLPLYLYHHGVVKRARKMIEQSSGQ